MFFLLPQSYIPPEQLVLQLLFKMAEEGKIRVERFNGTNFEFWKIQIEDYMYQKDLYLSLGGKAQKLREITDDELEVLDQKPLG